MIFAILGRGDDKIDRIQRLEYVSLIENYIGARVSKVNLASIIFNPALTRNRDNYTYIRKGGRG